MYALLLVVNVASAIAMVGMILLQHGRGAELGASFGRGSQGSLVSASGSTNFLSRSTSILAVIFFASALALGIVPKGDEQDGLLERLEAPAPASEPAVEAEVPQSPGEGG